VALTSHSGRPGYRTPGSYSDALAAAGGAPVLIPLDLPEEVLRAAYERLDGLLLSGGVDVAPELYGEAEHLGLGEVDAARDAVEMALTRWALNDDLPLLGICRGIQALNVAAGGTLWQDLPAQCPGTLKHDYRSADVPRDYRAHTIRTASGSRLAEILGQEQVWVNSFHHQAVKDLAASFLPVAWADDGIVEAIYRPDRRFVLAVQWHPEGMYRTDSRSLRIFQAFVASADGRG
jgi:putative glutamine amidotransferase